MSWFPPTTHTGGPVWSWLADLSGAGPTTAMRPLKNTWNRNPQEWKMGYEEIKQEQYQQGNHLGGNPTPSPDIQMCGAACPTSVRNTLCIALSISSEMVSHL